MPDQTLRQAGQGRAMNRKILAGRKYIMANKFTKSVLERQAKEYKTHRAQPETQDIPAPVQQASLAGPVVSAEETVPAQAELAVAVSEPTPPANRRPAAKSRQQQSAAPIPDLTAFIVREEGRAAKNKTFYLDAAVIEAIHRAATAQKVTDSKLVNDILKKILGV